MPYINLKTNLQDFEDKEASILELIVSKTKQILKKDEKVTSVLLEKVPFNNWYINKKNEFTFFLEIKITKDSNTKEEKALYIKEIFEGFKALNIKINKASYVLIDEIAGNSWGYGGITQEYRYSKS
ncbi:tautomerase family protein [Malaciobacter mytili]|uniref:4-oxalocrotonate tautomerase n=1 Tax=Malaciobacter mytili LMG 24559 TaxID=1032238 RepID=A0AAX2AIF4_9BACT|nr:4-oxalocrotonate tautomerase [Malaciobacter mytili]AXH15912.1 4-oxalocrotonate tautomerase family enzyme [Malaciobacter mytili LMG 24559]RXI46248.1 4-oxalocrotonate tautomerase [Malaciobacter mytili]RXK15930.1 4-oxalocrotonate tautomerase [Malaciobacter mytili LMG 24559]